MPWQRFIDLKILLVLGCNPVAILFPFFSLVFLYAFTAPAQTIPADFFFGLLNSWLTMNNRWLVRRVSDDDDRRRREKKRGNALARNLHTVKESLPSAHFFTTCWAIGLFFGLVAAFYSYSILIFVKTPPKTYFPTESGDNIAEVSILRLFLLKPIHDTRNFLV